MHFYSIENLESHSAAGRGIEADWVGPALTKERDAKTVAVIEYLFDASPQELFDAWIDPEFASQWWFTSPNSDFNSTRIDGRLGGDYQIVDRRDGITYRAIGTFIEFDPPKRLAFTFAMPDMSDEIDEITITIEPSGTGSKMTLEHACYRDFKEPYENGWGKMFSELKLLIQMSSSER